jgi:hypothetical protein
VVDTVDIEGFVHSYAQDLASGEGDRIAKNYDVPSLLLMAPGAAGIAVTDREELGKQFSAASTMYRDHGFGDPVGVLTRTEPVTEDVVLAWVTWDYRDTQHAPIYEADYIYGLRRADGGLPITSVYSINEPERVAAWLESRSQVK